MRSKVVEIEICSDVEMYADDNANYRYLDLDIPELQGLLPHADSMWVEALLLNCNDNEISWGVDVYVGYDRDHELGSQSLFADQATKGSVKVDATLATSYYRKHARFRLKWKLYTGTTPKQGRISVTLFVKTVGS